MNCQIIYSKMIFRSFNSGHCWHCTQFCSDLNQIAQFPVNIMSFHQNEFARKWVGADNREILIVVFSWFLMFFFVPTYLDDFFPEDRILNKSNTDNWFNSKIKIFDHNFAPSLFLLLLFHCNEKSTTKTIAISKD